MSHDPAKMTVLRHFLTFVAQYLPLQDARLATLGGEGWEAELWLSAGVRPENGWLIEREREASRRLIVESPYRYCPSLGNFPNVVRDAYGDTVGVDGFHLDLCGTLERSFKPFLPVIPLVIWRSTGRCLAITVADMRRNRTLERFRAIRRCADWYLGPELSRSLFQFLLREQGGLPSLTRSDAPQTANPEKGARREFGFFFRLFRLLVGGGWRITALPDRIERIVYVSGYGGRAFRMRTYLFHFGDLTTGSRAQLAQQFITRWMESSLRILQRSGVNGQINISAGNTTERSTPHGTV